MPITASIARETGPSDRARSGGARPDSGDAGIPGRILLPNGNEVPCVAVMRSPLRGEIVAQVNVAVNEIVICALVNVGILVGTVIEPRAKGFAVAFAIREEHRDRIAARLDWHAATADRILQLRRAPRIVPLHRAVELRLAETIVLPGTIVNMSLSGAAIALATDPGLFVGTRVRVGSRPATVVRAIEGGVAVQFAEPFNPETFDERIRP